VTAETSDTEPSENRWARQASQNPKASF